jgi:hypothetical protein
MKTSKIFFLIAIVTSISLGYTRCNPNDYSKEIDQVDSLIIVAVEMHQFMINIDSVDVVEKAEIVNADFKFVQDSLQGDLIIKSANYLDHLKIVKKMLNGFLGDYETLKKESSYSIDQLNDLKKDLQNGSLDPEEANKYINDEAKALALLNKHFQKLKLGLNNLNNQYFDLRDAFYNLYREYHSTT